MTSIVAIDESGNLGSEDRFFIMAAIVSRRVRDMKPAFKTIDLVKNRRKSFKPGHEIKFYNSFMDEKEEILESLVGCPLNIVYVCIDKDSDGYMDVRGKRLYKEAVRLLMPLVNDALETRDVIFHFDQNLGVSIGDLSEIAKQGLEGRNIKAVKKVQSHDNKCVQLADFVAGSIRSKYESNEDSYYELIAKKVSFAHEP